jgi:hypothetical protein
MKNFRTLFLICLLTLVSICELSAQEIIPVEKNKSDAWFLDSPKDWPGMIRPGIRGKDDRSLYYSDFFVPTLGTEDTLVFVNPKLVWDNHNTNEQNIGIGLRHLLLNNNLILGGNLYYDTQKSPHRNRFNQLGFGAEILSKWIDIRGNFYYPLSDKKEISQDVSYAFASKSLLKYTQTSYEEPLRGIDYEAGVLIPYLSDYVETRVYVGGYNYFSKLSKDINGIKARLEIMPSPLLTFNLEVSDDNTSNHQTYVGGYVTLPFSLGNLFSGKNPFEGWQEIASFGKGPRPVKKRMTDMVIRDIDVLLDEVTTDPVETTEVDGLTYVDNSNATGIEDGTYEHPYTAIQDGVDNAFGDKWVYIREGDRAYRLEEGCLMNLDGYDTLTIWGSGYDGGFKGITATGHPVLQSSELGNERPVALSDTENITLMGLDLRGGEGAVVYAAAPKDLIISHCIISEAQSFDGSFYMTGGIVVYTWWDTVHGADRSSGITITDNIFYDNRESGISIANFGAEGDPGDDPPITEDVLIARNTFLPDTQGSTTPTDYPISVESWQGITRDFVIEDNNILDLGKEFISPPTGITFYQRNSQTASSENIIIRNNNISSSVSDAEGILVEVRSGSLDNLVVSGNTVSEVGRGILLLTPGAAGDPGEAGGIITNAIVSGNTITNSLDATFGGLLFASLENGSLSVEASNNIIKNGEGYGVWLDCGDDATLVADLGGGILQSEGYNSIYDNELGGIGVFDVGDVGVQTAKYNWWGQADDPGALIEGDIDYTPWLTSDPN